MHTLVGRDDRSFSRSFKHDSKLACLSYIKEYCLPYITKEMFTLQYPNGPQNAPVKLPLAKCFRDNVLKSMVKLYKQDLNAKRAIIGLGFVPTTFKDPHTHALTGIIFKLETIDYSALIEEVEKEREGLEEVLKIVRKQSKDLIHAEARKICGMSSADV